MQIVHGEFTTLISVSKNKFITKIDHSKDIEFNLVEVDIKHDYASTVKAQGASIKDVYVLQTWLEI